MLRILYPHTSVKDVTHEGSTLVALHHVMLQANKSQLVTLVCWSSHGCPLLWTIPAGRVAAEDILIARQFTLPLLSLTWQTESKALTAT